MNIQIELDTLAQRIRQIREAQGLTLQQVSARSKGRISAIALGSYERGDRSVSARKLIMIANLYQVPISELFQAPQTFMSSERISIDVRNILMTTNPSAKKITEVIRNIARMRGDWNGEVISLKAQDINNLEVFTGLTSEQIQSVTAEYGFPRSK